MERVIFKLSIQLHVFTFLTWFRCLFIMLGLSLILIHFPAPFPTTWPYIDIYAQNDISFLLKLKRTAKLYKFFFYIFFTSNNGSVCVNIYIYIYIYIYNVIMGVFIFINRIYNSANVILCYQNLIHILLIITFEFIKILD